MEWMKVIMMFPRTNQCLNRLDRPHQLTSLTGVQGIAAVSAHDTRRCLSQRNCFITGQAGQKTPACPQGDYVRDAQHKSTPVYGEKCHGRHHKRSSLSAPAMCSACSLRLNNQCGAVQSPNGPQRPCLTMFPPRPVPKLNVHARSLTIA